MTWPEFQARRGEHPMELLGRILAATMLDNDRVTPQRFERITASACETVAICLGMPAVLAESVTAAIEKEGDGAMSCSRESVLHLVDALKAARETIRTWHGIACARSWREESWEKYSRLAPEMVALARVIEEGERLLEVH